MLYCSKRGVAMIWGERSMFVLLILVELLQFLFLKSRKQANHNCLTPKDVHQNNKDSIKLVPTHFWHGNYGTGIFSETSNVKIFNKLIALRLTFFYILNSQLKLKCLIKMNEGINRVKPFFTSWNLTCNVIAIAGYYYQQRC